MCVSWSRIQTGVSGKWFIWGVIPESSGREWRSEAGKQRKPTQTAVKEQVTREDTGAGPTGTSGPRGACPRVVPPELGGSRPPFPSAESCCLDTDSQMLQAGPGWSAGALRTLGWEDSGAGSFQHGQSHCAGNS